MVFPESWERSGFSLAASSSSNELGGKWTKGERPPSSLQQDHNRNVVYWDTGPAWCYLRLNSGHFPIIPGHTKTPGLGSLSRKTKMPNSEPTGHVPIPFVRSTVAPTKTWVNRLRLRGLRGIFGESLHHPPKRDRLWPAAPPTPPALLYFPY